MKSYEQKYKDALERAKKLYEQGTITESISYIFPELKGSEDERIRGAIIDHLKDNNLTEWAAWLEKQGESIRIKKGKNYLCTKTHKYAGIEWIECVKYYSPEDYSLVNQGCTCYCPKYSKEEHNNFFKEVEYDGCLEVDKLEPKLSEEEQNRFAKMVLSSCALSFINYLDAHKYEGKMCVSNGECEDIENAFHNAMWDRLHRYYCKYIEKQGEQKPFDYENATIVQKDFAQEDKPKIEPRFKIGDWVITKGNENVKQIVRIEYFASGQPQYILSNGLWFGNGTEARLWTIEDAKDGDVLNSKGAPFIYKKHDENYVYFYCGINLADEFVKANNIEPWDNNSKVYPATKEQHDKLFAKMRESGYEWDADEKKLINYNKK